MSKETTFVLHTYQSSYEDYIRLETDAQTADVEDPHVYARGVVPCGGFRKVTVKPGDNILLSTCEYDAEGPQTHLIVVPSDEAGFAAFKQSAERAAGVVVYERVLASQQGGFASDFTGKWMEPFITRSWIAPSSLQEALSRVSDDK